MKSFQFFLGTFEFLCRELFVFSEIKKNIRIFNHEDFEEPDMSNRIGAGEFGTVHKLQEKKTGNVYADINAISDQRLSKKIGFKPTGSFGSGNCGQTPLGYALELGFLDVGEILLSKGADITITREIPLRYETDSFDNLLETFSAELANIWESIC